MPWLIGVIGSALVGAVGQMIMRALAGLGIAFVAYNGLSEAMQTASQAFESYWSGAPADVVAMLKIMGIYTSLKIYLAAWGAAVGVRTAFRVLRFSK